MESRNPAPVRGWRALAAWVLAGAACSPAMAEGDKQVCDVEATKQELAAKLDGRLAGGLGSSLSSNRCSSILAVLRRAAATPRKAGRKLEDDKPLDVAEARKQLEEARKDPKIAAEIAAELEGEADPVRRALREAAVLYDRRKFKALEFLLSQELQK